MVAMRCERGLAFRSPLHARALPNLEGRRLSAMRSVGLDSSTLRTSYHYVRTPRCLQQLLSSLFRRACAAGLLLRLPASQAEQATARSAEADHVGGEEAARRGRP